MGFSATPPSSRSFGASSSRRPSARTSHFSAQKKRTLDLAFVTDLALFLTVLATLLCYAGRTPIGQFALLIGTCLTISCWLLKCAFQRESNWKWTGTEPLLALLLGLIAFQMTPLSPELLHKLSPQIAHYLGGNLHIGESSSQESVAPSPAEPPNAAHAEDVVLLEDEQSVDNTSQTANSGTGTAPQKWTQLTLSPHETQLAFPPFVCLTALFLVMVQRFQNREQGRRFLLILGIFSALFALFAILQLLLGNGKFFWVVPHPFSSTFSGAKGSFTNANHFAGFLALSLGPLLAWTVCGSVAAAKKQQSWSQNSSSGHPGGRYLIGALCLILLLVGILLSGSRGGIILAVVAIAVTLALVLSKRVADSSLPLLMAFTAIAALVGISCFGEQMLEQNAQELLSGDLEQLDSQNGRRFIWQANLKAQQNFRWWGTGLGTHQDIIPAFHSKELKKYTYTHAENSYLQVGTELGLIGWILLGLGCLMILIRLLVRCWKAERNQRDLPFLLGIAASFCVFLVHGTYDFGWYAPAYMLVLTIYLAFLFSEPLPESRRAEEPGQTGWHFTPLLMLCGVLGVGVWLGSWQWPAVQAEPAETRYLLYTMQRRQFDSTQEELMMLKMRLNALHKALLADPHHGKNRVRMATCLKRVFELNMLHGAQPMPLPQIRAAVYSVGFSDTQQLQDWLKKPGVMARSFPLVNGCLNHARKALEACPFFTKAWLIQADLCFVDSPDPLQPEYYLERARLVEPWSGEITFTAGFHAWNDGDIETALQLWQEVYQESSDIQQKILDLLTAVYSPDELIKLLHPDLNRLFYMYRCYAATGNPHQAAAAVRLASATLEQYPTIPVQKQEVQLLKAYNALKQCGLKTEIEDFAQQVLQVHEHSLALRKDLAHWFVKQKNYTEAQKHIAYCLQRVSHDPQLQQLMKVCEEQQNLPQRRHLQPVSSSRSR